MKRATAIAVAAAVILGGLVVLRVTKVIGGGPRVALIGDSITDQTTEDFEGRLGDWRLSIVGRPGFRADQLLGEVPGLARQRPEQVVVNLGTNDVILGWAPAETEVNLERVATGFEGARCIHLVTVTEHLTVRDDPAAGARAVDVNARIRALAARHGWNVVPWDQVVRDYDAGPQPFGPLTSDSIHPTELGRSLLADAYGQALRTCPQPPAP